MVLVSLSEIDRLICDEMERCAEQKNGEGYDVLNRLRDSIELKMAAVNYNDGESKAATENKGEESGYENPNDDYGDLD